MPPHINIFLYFANMFPIFVNTLLSASQGSFINCRVMKSKQTVCAFCCILFIALFIQYLQHPTLGQYCTRGGTSHTHKKDIGHKTGRLATKNVQSVDKCYHTAAVMCLTLRQANGPAQTTMKMNLACTYERPGMGSQTGIGNA